jgi:hypothetical protein
MKKYKVVTSGGREEYFESATHSHFVDKSEWFFTYDREGNITRAFFRPQSIRVN